MNRIWSLLYRLSCEQDGQGIAEYAVMLVVVLTLALGTIHALGSEANEVFGRVASVILPRH